MTDTASAPAVIPTSPARMPLSTMDRSGSFWISQLDPIAPKMPAAAASVVVTSTKLSASGSALSTEPPLKPNHPNHSRNTPIVASGIEWPMIGRTTVRPSLSRAYLPIRGPSISTPASAPHPPTECTSVEPAKSWNPSSFSQPPPQCHIPTMGYTSATYTALNTRNGPRRIRSATAPDTIVAAVAANMP